MCTFSIRLFANKGLEQSFNKDGNFNLSTIEKKSSILHIPEVLDPPLTPAP